MFLYWVSRVAMLGVLITVVGGEGGSVSVSLPDILLKQSSWSEIHHNTTQEIGYSIL